jgi:hypothetical protein
MIAESSWVSIVTVKCLWDDRKLVFGWIFGWCLSRHIFILIVLVHWAGCFSPWYPT